MSQKDVVDDLPSAEVDAGRRGPLIASAITEYRCARGLSDTTAGLTSDGSQSDRHVAALLTSRYGLRKYSYQAFRNCSGSLPIFAAIRRARTVCGVCPTPLTG